MSRTNPVKIRRSARTTSLMARSIGNIEPSLRRPLASRTVPLISGEIVCPSLGTLSSRAVPKGAGKTIYISAKHLPGTIAKHILGSRIDGLDDTAIVEADNPLGRRAEDSPQAVPAFSKRSFRTTSFDQICYQ